MTAKCPISAVDSFGPATDCYGHFDFSLLFEESILTIGPAISFIIVTNLIYFKPLLKSNRKVSLSWQLQVKHALWLLLIVSNAMQLGATASTSTPRTSLSIPACVIALAANFSFAILSHLAHLRSITPSSPLCLFLALTVVFDVARCRTLWTVDSSEQVASMMTASAGLKGIILLFESWEKRGILRDYYKTLPVESTAGILNQMFCWWMNPLLLFGFRNMHSLDTLWEVDLGISADANESPLFKRWNSCKSKQAAHSLLLVTLLHNKKAIGKTVIPRLFQTGFTFAQPFLVRRVLDYIQMPGGSNDTSVGTGLVLAYMIVYVGIALATSCTQKWAIRLVSQMRAGLVDLIYCRTLEIRSHAVDQGDAITLFNADVERITTAFKSFQELWASLIEIALSIWLLSGQLRLAAFAPASVIVIFTGAAISVASKAAITQKAWLDKIQLRVAMTASLLRVMNSVKMTGLAETLKAKINGLREDEIDASYNFRKILVKIVALTFSSTAMAPVASFGMYILLQMYRDYAILDVTRALTTLALLQLLLAPVSILIDTLAGVMGAVGCFERIRNYLNSDTRVDNRLHTASQSPWTNYSGRLMRNLSSRRQSAMELDEMTSLYGHLDEVRSLYETRERISALRDVYSFGRSERHRTLPSQHSRSAHVRGASVSSKDVEKPILSDLNFTISPGRLTMIIGPVGSGKSTLLHMLLGETSNSAGSVQVDFQDAAYCSQRPWISNTTVRQNIIGDNDFQPKWYSTVLEACCLTKDLENLLNGDLTPAGSSGGGLSGGQKMRISLARAIYSRKKTVLLDDIFSGLDATTEEAVFSSVFSTRGLLKRQNVTAILVTNAVHRLPASDLIIVLSHKGEITEQGSFRQLSSRPGYVSNLDLHQRQDALVIGKETSLVSTETEEALAKALPEISANDASGGDWAVYKYYIESFGWLRWWIFIGICSFYGFGVVFPQAWARWWADDNVRFPGRHAGYYTGIYLLLGILTIISLIGSCGFLVISIAPRVARTMHSRLLNAVMNAPVSFFVQTDAGSITNRFSQDLDLMDMELPVSLIHAVLMAFVLIAQTLVIASTAKYAAAALPICILAAFVAQKFYLRTSKVLRLLDIEAKSLLFSHFLETLGGLVTIRAFGWAQLYLKTNARYFNISQRPFYLLLCVQRWLGLVLDLLVSGVAVVLAAIAVKAKGNIDAGLMGLALLNIVGFSSVLKQLITNWTLLETSLGAVNRVKNFTSSVASERSDEATALEWNWPAHGDIEFNNVIASYDDTLEPVIKGISFKIYPGQRIGICGRSGSGKSSLLAALFRMIEPVHGSIIVDGIDISSIPRNDVRLRLNALPQEPFLLPGTIRDNIDPLGENPDSIEQALHLVGLSDLILDLPNGLDSQMPANMLSHGQKQLVCLARAMLRDSSILVLDEATSSVDLETEGLMQRIIDKRFRNHTIIAVAHRLNTILDYDYVGVMDNGHMVEWGSPRKLLQKDSIFRRLLSDSKGLGEMEGNDSSVNTENWI
ncbi:ABC transporter FUM19 [Lachnellula suecica]|uniref:ABC transporter FUM19 n=1 Tax=Lachnellula suecica TaxID=602035 RepID=A0A8T9CGG0_9HELO|nr:ABC transporter FUM19 [Lachnellula suecica]